MPAKSDAYDVVVVGSGVAGALTAWKLSTLGAYRILILEAGDNGIFFGQRLVFHHAMDTQGNRGDPYAPYKYLLSRKFAPAAEKSQESLDKQRANPKNYYDYTEDTKEPFKASYNRMVGGSTWVWRGNTPRFIPSDFQLHKRYGVGRDWPLEYGELEPWYCEAEAELGVSGNHDEYDGLFGAFRSQPFPMPGIALSYSDQRVKARIAGKTVRGTTVKVVTTPQARNSVPYRNRMACEGHNNCIPLCPIDAKYDATVHLRLALANKVELCTRAVVNKLEPGRDRRVKLVHYKDWSDPLRPQDRVVKAQAVVLAAHAIETPKILLLSDLANSSGQVGRNLMDHIQFEVIANFPEPLYPFRGPQSITGIESFRDGDFRRSRSAFRMTIGNDGWGRAGAPDAVIEELLKGDNPGKYGSRLPREIAASMQKMIRLSYSNEMLPDKANYVCLSDKRDALGIQRPRFKFDIGEYSRNCLREGYETAKALFRAMNATAPAKETPLVDDKGRMAWKTAAHIMGTTVMGTDPKDSVVDPFGRAHEVPNLWIVGASVFPTSGTANSTLTIAALSLRTAQAIHRGLT